MGDSRSRGGLGRSPAMRRGGAQKTVPGPASRRSYRCQRPLLYERAPHDCGFRGFPRFCAVRGCACRPTREGCRGDYPGQNSHNDVREPRSGSDEKSVEPGTHTRRLQQRIGGGGRGANVSGGDRKSNDRIGRQAGGVLRYLIACSDATTDRA